MESEKNNKPTRIKLDTPEALQYALSLKMALAEKNPLLQQEYLEDLQIQHIERNLPAAIEALGKRSSSK